MRQYKKYQKVGIDFLTRKSRRTFLLADDMGLGKTVEVIGALNVLKPKKVLIIALASIKINWMRELEEWFNYKFKCQIVNKVKDIIDKEAQFIIVNYDLVIYPEIFKQLKALDYDVLILDEAHTLSNMEAKRTKRVLNNEGLVRKANRIFALTGTPVRNRPKDFYVLLKVLAPETIHPFLAYEEYAKRYCGGYRDSYGVLQDKGASNIDELNERIQPFMLRRTKEEVLKELPPVIEKNIPLEITPEIAEVLAEEENLIEEINEYSPNSELGVQATIRRQLGEAKLPQVIEYVQNLLQTEEKVVIFAYHREVINQIRKRLAGYGVRCVQGGMNTTCKQMEVDLFVKDKNSRLFVGQITAAGVGVDGLQKVSNNVVFAEIDWVPGNMDQARDRLVRIGQENTVIAHYLVVPDTLEDNMMKSVINKGKVITQLLSSTKQEKRKGEKIMTIENSLERIATALETIAAAIPTEIADAPCTCNATTEAPVEAPKKKSTKKSAPKQEAPTPVKPEVVEAVVEAVVEEDDLDLGLDTTPAEPVKTYTADDVRQAISGFITSFDDVASGKKAALEVLNRYGYSKIPEIAEKDYAAIIADVSKGGK